MRMADFYIVVGAHLLIFFVRESLPRYLELRERDIPRAFAVDGHRRQKKNYLMSVLVNVCKSFTGEREAGGVCVRKENVLELDFGLSMILRYQERGRR